MHAVLTKRAKRDVAPPPAPEPYTLTVMDVARHFGYKARTSVLRNPVMMAFATKVGPRRLRWRVSDLESIELAMRED